MQLRHCVEFAPSQQIVLQAFVGAVFYGGNDRFPQGGFVILTQGTSWVFALQCPHVNVAKAGMASLFAKVIKQVGLQQPCIGGFA